MPNKPRPENRHRMVRVEDRLWKAARARAAERGETISSAIRRFLEEYIR